MGNTTIPVAIIVFVIMGGAWWYDRRLLNADKKEIKRIAQGLLDEIRALREKHGDTSAIADKILNSNKKC